MKRLNLQIDLNENEVFEKEFEEAIRAKARELARNEHSKLIEEEVRNEVKRLCDGNSWGYRDKLKSLVRELTRDEMKKVISDLDIETIAKNCVESRIDYIVSATTREVEQKCQKALENAISEAVQNKLSAILK
ncbi:MAG: hypothetical protein IJV71_05820 [Lachnospiraceae bacterium]|nr:hypothetical protein [Lachnospiraceae bacterium]